ncbi:MAG: hypothetical protein B6242_15355 [Anaerolineaceae bacterium 4572_78]|nr:MAG: hypothetical protein B6242_15355 [Anaerolineaceae bacterium 4572_78]
MFAKQLKTAIQRIRVEKLDKPKTIILDELGFESGKDGGRDTIYYWLRGNIPADLNSLERLTVSLINKGGLENRQQVIKFLEMTHYTEIERLCDRFFKDEPHITHRKETSSHSSPFIAGPPITHPKQFFGRDEQLRVIFGRLQGMYMENTAVIGKKRSGKTSMLHYIQTINTMSPSELRLHQKHGWLANAEQYQFMLVDFQDPRNCKEIWLLRNILTKLEMTIPTPCDLLNFTEMLENNLTKPTVIMFDEWIKGLQSPHLNLDFWDGLSYLHNHGTHGKLAFVLVAKSPPKDLGKEALKPSPFFNTFLNVYIDVLTMDDTQALINQMPEIFSENDKAWIIEHSKCYPALLQILCQQRFFAWQNNPDDTTWRKKGLQEIQRFAYLL